MSIRTHRWRRGVAAAAATVAAGLLLASCSGGGSSERLSESDLHDRALHAAKESKKCVIDYDLATAASAAHVAQHVEPVSATASLPENADEGSQLRTARATEVECAYRLGAEAVTVYTVAAVKGNAVTMMAPLIMRDAQMSSAGLGTYLRQVQKTSTATPVVTPSGNVASVWLPGADGDSVAMVLSCGGDQHTKLTASQVRTLAGELADQANW